MTKRHSQLISIFSIALIIGAFGVSGIISASNKTAKSIIDSESSDIAAASKPLILPENEDSDDNDINRSTVSSGAQISSSKPSISSLSLNKLSLDDDLDDDEFEDDSYEDNNDRSNSQNRNNSGRHRDDD